MPTVGIKRRVMLEALGQQLTDEEFDTLIFNFGVELDEITSEKQMKENELGVGAVASMGEADEEVIYKIDVPANRYDLLCVEGIARALRIYQSREAPPVFTKVLSPGAEKMSITVKASTASIRPYVVSAILRNVSFTQERYESFIDLQDKLHQNICRRRTYVAIGTHDLDTIQGPFTYEANPPRDISFIPLSQTKSFKADELLDFYRTSPTCKHLKPYTDIIYDSPVYPVIYDANRTVLSLPPIINGEHSKISLKTKNVFIECTGTDITKAKIVLNTMITMFSGYCEQPFTVEPVDVIYEASPELNEETPDLGNRLVVTKVSEIESMIFGKAAPVNLDTVRMVSLCDKMQLAAYYDAALKAIVVQVPPTRADILHAVDVMEDIAIAYGFNNIPKTLPTTTSIGGAQPLNQMTDWLREGVARAGFIELLTHGLCSHAENFKLLNQVDDGSTAVVLSNPSTVEFEVVRTTLIPGMLKTVLNNKAISLKDGLKLFEVSDVVLKDTATDVGARNVRRLCALYTGVTDGFEIIHGLIDRVMQLCGIPSSLSPASKPDTLRYTITLASNPLYFPGRCADIVLSGDGGEVLKLGQFGVVHPTVLKNYELVYPCSLVEMDIEPLV